MKNPSKYCHVFGENNSLGKYIPSTYEIYNPLGLVQLIGYIKYDCYKDGPVFFRGQTDDYLSMQPSLFRGITNIGSAVERRKDLDKYINDCASKNSFLRNTLPIARTPLLQHYGIKTEWLDIVDNIQTALWFSSHEANSKGKYICYEKSKNEYSYIYIMYFGNRNYPILQGKKERIAKGCLIDECNRNKINPLYGYIETNKYKIIDLRYMAPSLYKRPHAQHGLLFSGISCQEKEDIDYSDTILATIRIKTHLVLEWIGQNNICSQSFLFPSSIYDEGYQKLLEKMPESDKNKFGYINIY